MTQGNSLSTGFEKYHVPDENLQLNILKTGLVALDTNVLLDLYRYPEETSEDLLRAIEKLSAEGRLFIPHQVATEFWRGRLGVIAHLAEPHDEARRLLASYKNKTEDAIRIWARQAFLSDERQDELFTRVKSFFDDIYEMIDADKNERSALKVHTPTDEDEVLSQLKKLLEGHVGSPLSETDYKEAIEEAQRRINEGQPPGFEDREKEEDESHTERTEGAAGDYLVWEQMLREANHREQDLLFVTRDEKADWWLKWERKNRRPVILGAHRELVAEFQSRTGQELIFLTPDSFLKYSSTLGIEISPRSIENIQHLEENSSVSIRTIALDTLRTHLSDTEENSTLVGTHNRGSNRLRIQREDGSSSPLYLSASKNHWNDGGSSGWHTMRYEDIHEADYDAYILTVHENGEPTFFILNPEQMKKICETKEHDSQGRYHFYICSESEGAYRDDRESGGSGSDFTQFLNAWSSL